MPLNAHSADGRRRRVRRQGGGRRAASRSSTSRSGAASCPATSTGSTSSPSAASSASRRSCATRASTDFPARRRRHAARRAWRAPRALGLPVAVHAENDEHRRAARARRRPSGARDTSPRARSSAELEAIERALALARETGCSLHVVHVSTGARGGARRRGARARRRRDAARPARTTSCSPTRTLERLGALAKCAPPLRTARRARARCGRRSADSRLRRLRPLAVRRRR